MRSLIFLALMFFLGCAGGVADSQPGSAAKDAGVSDPVLDAAAAVPPAGAQPAAASVVMPAADVKLATPPAPAVEPADVDGEPASVDSVKSSASASSGAPVAVPATFATPVN